MKILRYLVGALSISALAVAAACAGGGGGGGVVPLEGGAGPDATVPGTIEGCPTCAILVDDIGRATALAVDESGVYFMAAPVTDAGSSPASLRKVGPDGTVVTLATDVAPGQSADILVTSAGVMFTGTIANQPGAWILPHGGTGQPTLFARGFIGSLATDGTFVYLGAGSPSQDGTVLRCPVAGCSPSPETLAAYSGGVPRSLVATPQAVMFVAFDSSARTHLYAIAPPGLDAGARELTEVEADGLAVKDDHAYFLDTTEHLVRCTLPACAPADRERVDEAKVSSASVIAVDGDELFHVSGSAIIRLQLARDRCDAGRCRESIDPSFSTKSGYSNGIRGLAVTPAYVYWITDESQTGNVNDPVLTRAKGALFRRPR